MEQPLEQHNRNWDRIVYQIEESRAGKTCQAFCPELVVTAFGDTPEEAREALRDQIADYLEDCAEMGVLEEVLTEAGFYDNGEAWVSERVAPEQGPEIRFFR